MSDLTTDIEYIAQGVNNLVPSPTSTPSDSVFMFLRCILSGDLPGGYPALPACADFVVWFSRYLDAGADHLNAHLSPTNLLANYWFHDLPFWTGYMTELSQSVAFESTWKTLRQMELSLPVCCEEAILLLSGVGGDDPEFLYQFGIDFNQPITTQYGVGELYTGSIKDGMLNLQLIFEDLNCKETPTVWANPCEL